MFCRASSGWANVRDGGKNVRPASAFNTHHCTGWSWISRFSRLM